MRRIVAMLVVALAVTAVGAYASDGSGGSASEAAAYREGELLVRVSSLPALDLLLRATGDQRLASLGDRTVLLKLREGRTVSQALEAYRRLAGVVLAEPNYLARADLGAPGDPSYGSQWSLPKIRAVQGWSLHPGAYVTTGGATVAVLDSGVDPGHPDLQGKVLAGANCLNGFCTSGGADDDNDHGTHVAGIAAAWANNGRGIAGVSFASRVLPVKVLNAQGSGSYAGIAAGIDWAVANGARVVNMSLSGTSYSWTLCSAVSRALSAGVVVVAAAGNRGTSSLNYPAACSGSIGVSSTNAADVRSSWSSYGSGNVFVSAPGESILSSVPGGSYETWSGTSMAAPHVAGLAALLLSQSPGRAVADVKTILATTSDKVGSGYGADPYGTCSGCTWSSSYGYGRINLERALGAGGSPPPPPPPTDPPPSPPGNLVVSNVGQTAATLSWSAPADNDVNGYRTYLNGAQVGSPTGLSYTFQSLSCGTSYTLGVAAVDTAQQVSSVSTANVTTATCPPPPPSTTTVAFPASTTILSGSLVSGSASSLLADDNVFYSVRSAGWFSTPSWYASFTGIPSTIAGLRVDYTGKASRTCTQSIAVYDWTTAGWTQISSRSVGTSEVALTGLAPTGTPLSRYRSAAGETRVRVSCSAFSFTAFTVDGEQMSLAFDTP